MRKILAILLALLPVCMSAQNRHHAEAGFGYAIPAELMAESLSTKESRTVCLYGEYRFQFTKGFSAGVNYAFVPNHKGEPLPVDSSETTPEFTIKTRYHSINAVAEYKYGVSQAMSFFVGLGGGTQYRYATFSHSLTPRNIWSADVFMRAGLEIYDHLRFTVGHVHDLHYPFEKISTGAPYYYFSVG